MRRIALISWLVVLGATVAGGVWASQRMASMHRPAAPSINLANVAPMEEMPLAAGRIVSMDPAAGRVTVRHQGIGRFYLDPGANVFHVQDPTLLAGLTPGDKIRFGVERDGKRYTITRIENSN